MTDAICSKLLFVVLNQYFPHTVLTFLCSFSSKFWYSKSVTEDLDKASAGTDMDLIYKHLSLKNAHNDLQKDTNILITLNYLLIF